MELFLNHYQRDGRPGNASGGQIEVAGIVPSTPIEAGNVLVGLESALDVTLLIAIHVYLVRWRLECIVKVAGSVPCPHAFLHLYVTHLNRQEILERGLPGCFINRGLNGERAGFLIAKSHLYMPVCFTSVKSKIVYW